MDELEVLRRHRPVHPPLSDAERASAQEQLMTHIDQTTHAGERPVVALSDPPRRTRRRLRAVGLAGAAAALAAVALAVGTTGGGPAPLRAEPTAAEQLEAMAEVAAAGDPYPDGPYAVDTWQRFQTLGSPDTNDGTTTATAYRVSDEDLVTRYHDCEGDGFCGVLSLSAPTDAIPADGTPAEVRAGIEAQVDEFTVSGTDDERRANRLGVVVTGLRNPALTPGVRAELLRIVAEEADLSVEDDVASALGLVGTRFVASFGEGRLALIIDPADGYLLEVSSEGPATVVTDEGPEAVPAGDQGSEPAVATSQVAYARPVAADPLPADVQALADAVAAIHPRIEASYPQGGCASPSLATPNSWGIDIPEGLRPVHCWLP